MRPGLRRAACLLLAACALVAHVRPSLAAPAPPTTREAAERLATSSGSRERERALAEWAKRAPFDDLLWVLRHGPATLGSAELPLVQAARKRVPHAQSGVARQLALRAALLDPRVRGEAVSVADLERLRPRASVFRIASLLPDVGDYADYATSVHRGLTSGLAWERAASALPLELARVSTGDEDPARAIAAMDSLSHSCGVVVGALLSVPTLAVAAAARAIDVPLVSPTATDESIGSVGESIAQVGPGQRERGRVLARTLVSAGQRVALVGERSVLRGEFARAFAAECEAIGASLVRQEMYAPGAGDFRAIARSLKAAQAQVAFWDGEPREVELLVKQLATESVRVQLCGGSALSPDQHHVSARALLDGAVWAGEDWKLTPPLQTLADSTARAQGEADGAGSLWVRGFLAGRSIASAIDAGTRTPGDVARALRSRDADRAPRGFLDLTSLGARLPLFVSRRGAAVEYGAP